MFRSSLTLTITYTRARVHYKHYDTNNDATTGLISLRRHCLYGGRGIRTPGAVNPAVFKTAAIVHSAIPPDDSVTYRYPIWKGEGQKSSLKACIINTSIVISAAFCCLQKAFPMAIRPEITINCCRTFGMVAETAHHPSGKICILDGK